MIHFKYFVTCFCSHKHQIVKLLKHFGSKNNNNKYFD